MQEQISDPIDLCGLWRFQPDPTGDGPSLGYPSPGYDDHRWREVRVPSGYATGHPDLAGYEGDAWYRRRVSIPERWLEKRVLLHSRGVNVRADVWVNGRWVGRQFDPYLPLELRIDHVLTFGAENLIAVRTDNTRRAGEVPGLHQGWRNVGGLLRGIELHATDPLYLDHVNVSATPTSERGDLTIRATIANSRSRDADVTIVAAISDATGNLKDEWISESFSVPAGAKRKATLENTIADVKTWSPEFPHLYTLEVALRQAGALLESQRLRIGFRTVEVIDGTLHLNGKPLSLTGFNRHEDAPNHTVFRDPNTVRSDLEKMREAGANFVRLCHYPHDPSELHLCDEIGLLVMAEIPLYWWKGRRKESNCGDHHTVSTLRAARRQLRAMIHRDINHPSIILWSVSNETDESQPEVAAGNADLIRLAKHLDPTRLAVHVSNRWREHPHFTADDIICINGYPGYEAMRRNGKIELAALTERWRTELAGLNACYPDKPILITEFGYPAIDGIPDGVLGTDTQAEVIEHEFQGMDASYVCGTTIWCWADHPWPENTFAYCNRLNQSPFGILTRDRREKRAYHTIRTLFRERQGPPEPERVTETVDSAAGHQVKMIRPHLDDIPQVAFPNGFKIRPMRLDEAGLWTDIWRDAEPYANIRSGLFHSEFGHDLQATQWRSFIVANPRGTAVATISAWYNRTFKGKDYGMIHWVAVRKAYWGRGLGKAMLTHALNRMAMWHNRAFLGTQTRRIPAIKIYLDFGFVPDLDEPGAVEAWREVKAQLDHPILEALDLETPAECQPDQGGNDR